MDRVVKGEVEPLGGLDLLVRMSRSGNPEVRADALRYIPGWRSPGRERQILSILIAALDDPDHGVSRAAVDGVARLGRMSIEALPALSRLIAKAAGHEGVRQAAVMALGAMDPEDARVEEIVLAQLGGGNSTMAIGAALAIARMEPAPAWGVEPLLAALGRSSNSALREYAVKALGRIGAPARSALGLLDRLAGGQEASPEAPRDLRRAAREAAERIRGELDKSR